MGKLIKRYGAAGILIFVAALNAQDYTVKRESNGPFALKIGGTQFNDGSTLERSSILLNHPECPVMILASASRIEQKESDYVYVTSTDLRFNQSVAAVSWTLSTFDVFGRHIQDYERIEIKDYTRGWGTFPSTYKAEPGIFGDTIFTELTTVTYINSVRLADGTVWRYDEPQLEKTLQNAGLLKPQN